MGPQSPLAGQTSLVTGGSRGIGLAIARRLSAMGSKVAICGRDRDRLEESAALLRREGAAVGAVLAVPADVAKAGDVARLVDRVTQELGPLDIVVNNAGIGVFGPGQDASEKDWDRVLGTNLKGVFLVCRAVAPGMIARRTGHIINISSLAGKNAFANGAVYCASKAAEKSISEGLKIDLMGTSVRVTSIDAGMVETDFSKVRFRGDEEKAAKIYQNITPLQPEDVAEAIVWAASRPPHVNIHNVLMTTIDQANSTVFNRRG